MAEPALEQRVSTLETAVASFLSEMALIQRQAEERNRAAEVRMTRFQEEMRESRNESRRERADFKEEMRESRGESRREMADFKAEMRESRSESRREMADFKEEMRQSRRALDKKWSDLANKMGTIIEDVLAPNLSRLAREHFALGKVESFAIRFQRRVGNSVAEFDTILVGKDAVLVGEAKSSPDGSSAASFAAKLDTFFRFFPEYQGRRLIGVFGSWAIDARVIAELTRHRIYAMQMGEETMELVNAQELEAS